MRAAELWLQASLEQRQRFQQLSFPEGLSFDGTGFVGTGVTAPGFNYLAETTAEKEGVVDQTSVSWNQVQEWLRRLDAVRRAA